MKGDKAYKFLIRNEKDNIEVLTLIATNYEQAEKLFEELYPSKNCLTWMVYGVKGE